MKQLACLLLAAILVFVLAGCLPVLQPPASTTSTAPARVWSITANDTRIAQMKQGEHTIVWLVTLELALIKNGGDTAAGSYTGVAVVCYEMDYIQPARWPGTSSDDATSQATAPESPLPAGLASLLPGTQWLVCQPLEVELLPADESAYAAAENTLAACSYAFDSSVLREELSWSFLEMDEYHNPLGSYTQPLTPSFQSEMQYPLFQAEADPETAFARIATALAQEAGEYWEAPESFWRGQFPACPAAQPNASSLPLQLFLFPNNTVSIFLSGLIPLAPARPFEGKLYSGGVASATMPQAPPPQSSSLLPGGSSSPSRVLSDAELALQQYGLPLPAGTLDGPKTESNVVSFTMTGMRHNDARAYVRKLKLAGYVNVLSEMELQAVQMYSFVATNEYGRQISFLCQDGKATLSIL